MTGWKILAGVLLALFALSWVRLGGRVEYSGSGLMIWVRVGAFSIQVFPLAKKKKPSRTKEDKKKEQQAEPSPPPTPAETAPEPAPKKGGTWELVKRALPLVCQAAGELKRKIRIDKLCLYLTVAARDAAGTAMAYGYANMALGMIWPLIEQNFQVKEPRIRTAVDFTAQSPTIYISAAFSARTGQLVSFAVRFGWKFLRLYGKYKPRAKNKKEAI